MLITTRTKITEASSHSREERTPNPMARFENRIAKNMSRTVEEKKLIHSEVQEDIHRTVRPNAQPVELFSHNIVSSDEYQDLSQYVIDFARLIAAALGSKYVEIIFFDQEILDMLLFLSPKLQDKLKPLAKNCSMIAFKSDPVFEMEESKIVSNLHWALAELYSKVTINFRMNSFFVPILYNWMQKGSKVVGTVIILNPSQKRQTTVNDVNTSKMVVSARLTKQVNTFTNAFFCDLRHRHTKKELDSLIKLSKLDVTRHEAFKRARPERIAAQDTFRRR